MSPCVTNDICSYGKIPYGCLCGTWSSLCIYIFSCFVLFTLGEEAMPVLHIHRQSGYLLGRDRKVADIPVDHPSCSKQHAVLQFRSVEYTVC